MMKNKKTQRYWMQSTNDDENIYANALQIQKHIKEIRTECKPRSILISLLFVFCLVLLGIVVYLFIRNLALEEQNEQCISLIKNQAKALQQIKKEMTHLQNNVKQFENETIQVFQNTENLQNITKTALDTKVGFLAEREHAFEEFHSLKNLVDQRYETLSDGWISLLNGYAYKMVSTSQSWNESRQTCQTWGGDLVVYGAQNMQWRKIFTRIFSFSYLFWIGSQKTNNTWFWINDNVVNSTSMYWIPGQPDNFNGNEECANIRVGKEYKLLSNDDNCINNYQALCEKEI